MVQQRKPQSGAPNRKRDMHLPAKGRRKVPDGALRVAEQAVVVRVFQQQRLGVVARRVGDGHGAVGAVPRAMAREAAEAAADAPQIHLRGQRAEAAAEVLRAVGFIQPVDVEQDQPPDVRMLPDLHEHLMHGQLQRLKLVDAFVAAAGVRAAAAEIAGIAQAVQVQFAEAKPAFSVVLGDGDAVGVAVRENVLPDAALLVLGQRRPDVVLRLLRQRTGVVEEKEDAAVGEAEQVRIGQRGMEGRRRRPTPALAVVVGIGHIVVIGRGAQHRHQAAVVQFQHGGLDAAVFPPRPLMRRRRYEAVGGRKLAHTPAFAVVVREENRAVAAIIGGEQPAPDRTQRERQAIRDAARPDRHDPVVYTAAAAGV